MLSSNNFLSTQHVQYMSLFLVPAVNSAWFQIYGVTRSYSSHRSYALLYPMQHENNTVQTDLQ